MRTDSIRMYGYRTGYNNMGALDQIKLEHVFVVSGQGNNWNCFGGGCECIGRADVSLRLAENGYIDWIRELYDIGNEGHFGQGSDLRSAMGLLELRSGVCQNVANRILLFSLREADARISDANEIVTLVYGKYGYELDAFRMKIIQAADLLGVGPDLRNEVLQRVDRGVSPEAELDVLLSKFEERTVSISPEGRGDIVRDLLPAYSAYQKRRQNVYGNVTSTHAKQDIQKELAGYLAPSLGDLVRSAVPILKKHGVPESLICVDPERICGCIERLTGVRG